MHSACPPQETAHPHLPQPPGRHGENRSSFIGCLRGAAYAGIVLKRLNRLTFWFLFVLGAGLLLIPARVNGQSAPAAFISISGTVVASGKHAVYVALWDRPSFLQKPVQGLRIPPGAATNFQFRVPPGDWALSAFEDLNDNGILDEGLFGPKEPSGFWRPFHAWRKPRFADVSSRYDKDTSGIQIQLH